MGNSKKAVKAVLLTLFFAALLAGGGYLVYRLAGTLGGLGSSEGGQSSSSSSAQESSSAVQTSSTAEASGTKQEKGVFGGYFGVARERMKDMTLKEMVGQIFVFSVPADGQIKFIDDYQPGGYCMSARDFNGKTAEQVQEMTESYQRSSKVRMILCCDEEGGTVVRVSSNDKLSGEKFASPRDVYAKGGLQAIEEDTLKKAQLLKSLGVNMNLAPVVDIAVQPSDFMYDRSLGESANTIASFARLSVEIYNKEGISCALKHFPGYGNNVDTHKGMAYDRRSLESMQNNDLVPFQFGIDAGAPCVLVSHNVVDCMDPDTPATLSPKVHEYLRQKLGFTGVIMTDDLSMEAIPQFTKGKNPCVSAFLAGNDILLTSGGKTDFDAVFQAVQDGTISRERLEESVLRILAWKYKMKVLT